MSALVKAESSNGNGAPRAMAAFRSLLATLAGGGPLDRHLMVRAPDLWLLYPAASPLLGIVGALFMLVCPPWVLSGILFNLTAVSVFVTAARQGSFGHRVTTFRPWYFRYRPLLIAILPLSAFLPGYLCGLCLSRWATASSDPLRYPPAEVLTFALLLAASFGSLLELDIRLGDNPISQLLLFLPFTYFFIGILSFLLLINIHIVKLIFHRSTSLTAEIALALALILEFTLILMVVRKQAVVRKLAPRLLFLKKWVATCIILLSSGAVPAFLFVELQPGKILACAAVAFASLSCPLATFRILEPWIDQLAFAPRVYASK